jgi:hypothetical protein
MAKIKMTLKNDLANIESNIMAVTEEELSNIINLSKTFYQEGVGFEMWTDDGFVVVPPEITKRSILTINILEEDENVQDI